MFAYRCSARYEPHGATSTMIEPSGYLCNSDTVNHSAKNGRFINDSRVARKLSSLKLAVLLMIHRLSTLRRRSSMFITFGPE
jgi:hypothetical protein